MKASKSKLGVILVVILLIAVGIAGYIFLHWGQVSTDDAALDGRLVSLSSNVPGYVKVLNITDNQRVKEGDVLLEIDPADYIIRRDKAQAALDAAKAAASASHTNVETTTVSAPSNLDAAQAQVASAEASWDKAASDLKRMQRLSNEARSQEQLEQAVAAEKAASSNLEDARAKLRTAQTAPQTIAAAQADSDELFAKVKQAEADLAQAEKDLNDTKVLAPMDGRVTRRGVERGDYVQTGQPLGSLVANEIWVTANFKENQLKDMKPGQRVTIEVDAFTKLNLEGKVDSIQSGTGARFSAFPPENATGNFVKIVQRVPVKIVLDQQPDPNLALGPGMSVVPTVYTDEK